MFHEHFLHNLSFQINGVFDTISYSKGASVLRMLESFLRPGEFMAGVTNFLDRYAFQNAITQDLMDEFDAVSSEGLDVTRVKK